MMTLFRRSLILFFAGAIGLVAKADAPKVQFTDSSAAGLAATKRVAITSVIVSFQTSTGNFEREKGSLMNLIALGKNVKDDALTILQLPNLDPQLADAITGEVYRRLQADLTANGFEVVPEAAVLASPNYQKIIQKAGFPNQCKFANFAGDTLLVSPAALKPYLAYGLELGQFGSQPKGFMKGWVSATGKSSTPGGPTPISLQDNWGIPALEVALAKELNAHVLKATYCITLGTATASIGHSFAKELAWNYGTQDVGERYVKTVAANGNAFARIGLFPLQSRLAFRAPNGNAKWQTVPRFKTTPPAKDGDVVVTLAEPLLGGTEFFSLEKSSSQSGLFHPERADFVFRFTATITDPAGYASEAVSMISTAQQAMLAPVKR